MPPQMMAAGTGIRDGRELPQSNRARAGLRRVDDALAADKRFQDRVSSTGSMRSPRAGYS